MTPKILSATDRFLEPQPLRVHPGVDIVGASSEDEPLGVSVDPGKARSRGPFAALMSTQDLGDESTEPTSNSPPRTRSQRIDRLQVQRLIRWNCRDRPTRLKRRLIRTGRPGRRPAGWRSIFPFSCGSFPCLDRQLRSLQRVTQRWRTR
jgi:hypothetical protein